MGLIYLTAQQFASAFHTLAAAACIRLDNAECYMLLGSMQKKKKKETESFQNAISFVNFYLEFDFIFALITSVYVFVRFFFVIITVCLRNLNDHGNAYLAFERSVMLPDAVKNPLIYLNFAVYNMQMKRYELAVANINDFFSVVEHVNVRKEV